MCHNRYRMNAKKNRFSGKKINIQLCFINVLNGKLYQLKTIELQTILEVQMMYPNTQISSLSYIDDVTFCEPNHQTSILYLIENDFYVQVQLNQNESKIRNYLLVQLKNRIQKIIIQQRYSIMVLTYQLNKTDSPLIETAILLNQLYPTNNIHFHYNLLFLQNQFELNVLMNSRINQTYQIFNTSIQFFDFTNLFCQYDQTTKVISFHKYQPLSAFIKLELKYIYVVQKSNLLRRDTVINCFRILYQNNTEKNTSQFNELIKFQNNCQDKQQILLEYNYPNSYKNSSYKLQSSDGSLKVSIRKYQDFKCNCLSRRYTFYLKSKFQLTQRYIFFQYESFFYIYDCKQHQFSVSINLDQYYVLEFKSAIYYVSRNNSKDLRGVQISADFMLNFNIKLNEVITSFKQTYQSIFLYTNSSNLPLIILINSEKHSLNNYLSKNLYQPEPILFYIEFGSENCLKKQNLRCYQFSDSLIISIQAKPSFDCYMIVAIQNSARSLIINYFYDQQLHQISNYTFQDYSFYYPFKYKINADNLAILIEINNSLYIAIFSYNESIQSLNEIIVVFISFIRIETDDCFFQLDSQRLLLSFDKVWRYSFLKKYFVELEIEKPHDRTLFSNFLTILKEQGVQLRISIENQCFELRSLMKSSIIEIQNTKSLKLNISDIFYGPIFNLTLLNNPNIILKGPFQFKQALSICKDQTSTICFREYHLEQKSFSVFVKENQILEVIKRNSFNDYYVTWIKQQYYLFVSFLFDFLIVELIKCSDNQSGDCKMISNLNDNFKMNQINISDTIRVGNLIRLKDHKNKAFIFIDDINFNIQMFHDIIIDIQYIKKSNNQYLILQNNEDSKDLVLAIYSIYLHQKYQIYSLVINETNYAELIQNGNYFQRMKLVSCKYSGDLINIKLLIMDQFSSLLFQLNLDQQKNQIQFLLQNKFRNFIFQNSIEITDFVIQYIDDTILVLKQTSNTFSQFYEFQDERNSMIIFINLNFQCQQTNSIYIQSIFLLQIHFKIVSNYFIFKQNKYFIEQQSL